MCNRGKGPVSRPIRAFSGGDAGVQACGFVHWSVIFCTAVRRVCAIPASFARFRTLPSTHPGGSPAAFSHPTHILYPHIASLIHEKHPFIHPFGLFAVRQGPLCTLCTFRWIWP